MTKNSKSLKKKKVKQHDQNIGLPLDGTTTSEESQNNSRFFSEEIEGTPFTAVGLEGKWFISWGEWRISDELETREAIDEYMEKQKWNLICAYMVALQQAARRYDRLGETPPEQNEIQDPELERALERVEKSLTN